MERRYLSASETEALINIPDESPDSARTVEARSDMEFLKRTLAQLPGASFYHRLRFVQGWRDGPWSALVLEKPSR